MPISDPQSSWAYIPRFRNVARRRSPFVRGYGVQVFTLGRNCGLTVFGEMLPHPDNRVTLDASKTDKWGIPVAQISCIHRDNELAMVEDQIDACREILDAANFESTNVPDRTVGSGDGHSRGGYRPDGNRPEELGPERITVRAGTSRTCS